MILHQFRKKTLLTEVTKLHLCPLQGIEPNGNRVMRPAVFTVDTFSAGQGQVMVYLDHPDGTREEVYAAVSVLTTIHITIS